MTTPTAQLTPQSDREVLLEIQRRFAEPLLKNKWVGAMEAVQDADRLIDAHLAAHPDPTPDVIAALEELYEAWVEYLSAKNTIDGAGYMDNYTDAARARKSQAQAVEKARAAIAKCIAALAAAKAVRQ